MPIDAPSLPHGEAQTDPLGPAPALQRLKVVEIATGVSGPFCGKMLADYGGDVIKVELPSGDETRTVGPFATDGDEAGAMFLWLNANKRGMVLDWRRATGRRVLRELLAQADVLIENGPPGTLGRFRLTPGPLSRLNPRLIVTSVTPFGITGPWRKRPATDLTISALGGMSFYNGVEGQEPLREPGRQAEAIAGIYGCIGTLTALVDRLSTGVGQVVEVSAQEALLGLLTPYLTRYSYQANNGERHPPRIGSQVACADGYVNTISGNEFGWQYLIETFGLGPEALAPEVATQSARRDNQDKVKAVLEPALAPFSKAALFHLFTAGRLSCGMVMSIPEMKDDPHLQDREFFAPVADSRAGKVVYPGPPFRLKASGWSISRPAPRLGEHTDEILGGLLGYSSRRIAALRRAEVIRGIA